MNMSVKKKETGKKINAMIKLNILAGKATPSPPIGPALGQRGLNIMEFCKAFNAATQNEEPGCMIPVVITAYADKTFTFIMKSPTATYFIKKYAEPSIKSGSKSPGKGEFVAKITRAKLMEIASKKIVDSNANDLDKMRKTLEGTAYSMGVEVID